MSRYCRFHLATLFCASLLTAFGTLTVAPLRAQTAPLSVQTPKASWPGPGQLFVGSCYQPVDRSPAEIEHDIAIMHGAGFNVVRMGDLSWDAFEPAQGKFTFEWFDRILDQMQKNGIRVILDIPGSPAPIWLHHRYPGVDIIAQNGTRLPPAERYMDDISDPDYIREVSLLADTMMKRYAHNPAIIAIGYDNEIGNGYLSYSPEDRLRFIEWLKQRYGSLDALNRAWATQRWSRHLDSFDEIDLPLAEGPGSSERFLDLHRFWSDVVIARLNELDAIRRRDMPDLPTISNLWDTSPRRGFDYLSSYKSYVSYGAEGFYPGDPVSGAMGAMLTKGDLTTPIWFNEFTAGGGGFYGTPGRSRMYAYLGLALGTQGILAWTFNSHRGGEEQALFGLVDHDNTPSWKVDEFARIAAEFKRLAPLGFPRYTHPEVAIAYSFDSFVDSHPNGPSSTTLQYFKPSYTDQVQGAFEPLFRANVDTAFVNPGHAELSQYKLVVVPADYVMDSASEGALRTYVQNGGTVLMTAFSAKVNESGLWFDTPLPGALSDVFGLKTNAFYDSVPSLVAEINGKQTDLAVRRYEVLEPSTARTIFAFTNTRERSPYLTSNTFGRGNALYVAVPANASSIAPALKYAETLAGVRPGPTTPDGVYARVVEGRTLYVNTTGEEKTITLPHSATGILSGSRFERSMILAPLDAELLQ